MSRQATKRDGRSPPRGLTLVEVVVSAAATAILLGGMTSAVILAARALPENSGALQAAVSSGDVLERIASELLYAVHITENTATAVTFTVADRNGDGSPERIRYAWSGTAGDPLTRQYNNGAAVTVLDNVNQFALGYDLKSVTEQYPGPPLEGAESELSKYIWQIDLKDFKVDSSNWIGQYFQPPPQALPGGTISWRVTRVRFRAKKEGFPIEQTFVQIRTANPDKTPTGTILEQQVLSEATLTDAYQWVGSSFTNVAGLGLNQGVCLVLQHGGGGPSAEIGYDDGGGSNRLTTSNGGGSWNVDGSKSMRYYVYGKVSTPGPNQSITRQYVTGVRVTLQVGADADARLDTAIHMPNAPEILSAVWVLDFDTNPTTLDMNADGVADWVRRDGQAFNPATLVNGVWYADATLDTRPNNDFTQIITVDVRFRNTSIGGNGAVFWINADWSGGTFAPLFAYLQLQVDGTQTLSAYHKLDNSTPVRLVSVPGLPSGFVPLRLLIDPGYNTINVKVNGMDTGTYVYNTFIPPNNDRFATVQASGSNAEFDSVSIRVGGSH